MAFSLLSLPWDSRPAVLFFSVPSPQFRTLRLDPCQGSVSLVRSDDEFYQIRMSEASALQPSLSYLRP